MPRGSDGTNTALALSNSVTSTGKGSGSPRPSRSPSCCSSVNGTRNFAEATNQIQ